MTKFIAVTLDQDWCHESLVNYCLKFFNAREIPITFFVTNFDQKWVDTNNIEWGVHPNFSHGSSHGDSYQEVISRASISIPGAVSWRAHSLLSSSKITDLVNATTNWRIENNFYLPEVRTLPNEKFPGTEIIRVPVNWEDDLDLRRDRTALDLLVNDSSEESFTVFNFHPIHIFLNSFSMHLYDNLKQQNKIQMSLEDLSEHRNLTRNGIENQLDELINFVKNDKCYKLVNLRESLYI